MYRIGRIVLWVPLAIAGTVTILSAQTAIIVGALMIGTQRRSTVHENDRSPAARPLRGFEASPPPADPIDFRSHDSGAETLAFFPLRAIKPDSMILMPGEECYLQERARLIFDAGDHHRVGGRGGFSFGMPRNDHPRSREDGSTATSPRSSDGRVYVTNTRVVFIGTVNVNMHIAQILSLDRTPTGALLGFINERPIEIITGTMQLGMTLHQVIHRATEMS